MSAWSSSWLAQFFARARRQPAPADTAWVLAHGQLLQLCFESTQATSLKATRLGSYRTEDEGLALLRAHLANRAIPASDVFIGADLAPVAVLTRDPAARLSEGDWRALASATLGVDAVASFRVQLSGESEDLQRVACAVPAALLTLIRHGDGPGGVRFDRVEPLIGLLATLPVPDTTDPATRAVRVGGLAQWVVLDSAGQLVRVSLLQPSIAGMRNANAASSLIEHAAQLLDLDAIADQVERMDSVAEQPTVQAGHPESQKEAA